MATEADDVTADMVISELNRRSVPVVRFNPAGIGADLTVSARFGTCPAPVAGQVRALSRTADLAHVRAVYWRRGRARHGHEDGGELRRVRQAVRAGGAWSRANPRRRGAERGGRR